MQKRSMILVLGVLLSLGCTPKGNSERVINVASWSNYISPDSIAKFQARTGIRVQLSNYSSNEELLAKLQAGASGYDVAIPSDYMVFAMSKLGLLHPLDKSKIPHAKGIDRAYLGRPFDAENRMSLPYDWGTTGIAINRSLYTAPVKGWKDVFGNPRLAGKYTLLDDVRETLGAALKASGKSLNSVTPADLEKAKALLIKVRKDVKAFTSEPTMPLAQGETALAHAYVSDSLQARKRSGGKIEYVVPEEGCTLWIDNLVIPAGAAHIAEAHQFIDFMLEPETVVQTTQAVFVAPVIPGALGLLPPEIKKDAGLFPSKSATSRCEMMTDLGEGLMAWDRIWTEIKAGSN